MNTQVEDKVWLEREIAKAVEEVNYFEAAEGSAYFTEARERKDAYSKLSQLVLLYELRYGKAELERVVDGLGPLLFDREWLLSRAG